MWKQSGQLLIRPLVGVWLLFLSAALYAESGSPSMGSQVNPPGLRDFVTPSVASTKLAQKAMQLRLREFSTTAPTIELAPPSADEIATILRNNGAGTVERALQIGATRKLSQDETTLASQLLANLFPLDQTGLTSTVKVSSLGAKAVRLRIDFLNLLPDDVTFRFRGVDSEDIEVMTGRQVKQIAGTDPFFWTPVTSGEAQLIEITLPDNDVRASLAIAIGGVSHMLANPTDPSVANALMASGLCEVDVACYTGAEESSASKAVARMVFTDISGSYLCTGTLLNDADPRTYVPYFYTANHCISSQSVASSLVTYWRYEATSCGSGLVGSYTTLSSGAFLFFTDSALDATLLVLNQDAPVGAVLSGWNAASIQNTPAVTTIGIHHPAGDVKKLSIASPILGFAPFNGVGTFINAVFTSGTTEPGSSGSGLFTRTASDGSYQLRGGLKGGNSSCTNTAGNNLYSRLDLVYPFIQPYINGPITTLPTAALLTPSSLSVSLGVPLTLTARLVILSGYPYATGTVTFYDGATPIGTATVQPEFVTYPYEFVEIR